MICVWGRHRDPGASLDDSTLGESILREAPAHYEGDNAVQNRVESFLHRQAVELACQRMYQARGLTSPDMFLWVPSPLQGYWAACLINGSFRRCGIRGLWETFSEVKAKRYSLQAWWALADVWAKLEALAEERDAVWWESAGERVSIESPLWPDTTTDLDASVQRLIRAQVRDEIVGLPLCEGTRGGWWGFRGVAILVEQPVHILFDTEHRPHCYDGMAIKYADGWGVYVRHGIRVP